MTLILYLYGFQMLFSAQPLFDSWFIMFFNLTFTSLPVLFFGIFEQDLEYEDLLRYPVVHKDFSGNATLSFRNFCIWVFYGMFHACVAYYGVLWTLNLNPNLAGDMDMALFGTLVIYIFPCETPFFV